MLLDVSVEEAQEAQKAGTAALVEGEGEETDPLLEPWRQEALLTPWMWSRKTPFRLVTPEPLGSNFVLF